MVGDGSLAGAIGLTLEDQDAIDDANAGLCRVGLWTPEECERATEAAQIRRAAEEEILW